MANHVFIAHSLDGYIADRSGGIDWLPQLPVPEGEPDVFAAFMQRMDAIVMGRRTFQTVLSFGQWPYTKPVYVLSRSMPPLSAEWADKAQLWGGEPARLLDQLKTLGYRELYIDGGQVVQYFLAHDWIDELTLTRVPILLGGGVPLFGALPWPLHFTHVSTQLLSGGTLSMSTYHRLR